MKTQSPFRINREDGRTFTEVLIDYVSQGDPGRIYGHGELSDVLSATADRKLTVADVRNIVNRAQKQLSHMHSRALRAVRGVGYKLAHAKEHKELALIRKVKADRQLRRGVQLLQDVRWDELDENSRKAHEGTMLLMSAIYEHTRALTKRVNRIDEVLKTMRESSESAEG